MKTLYVLFDAECGLCRRCRRWLQCQPAFVEMKFLPLQSPEVGCRFPGIERFNPRAQLLVVSDEGAVYQGPHAWIMCLWALREYREWSQRLAGPALLPWARRACELLSDHRLTLSAWFKTHGDEVLEKELCARADEPCKDGCRYG